jgi:hypothetical protein
MYSPSCFFLQVANTLGATEPNPGINLLAQEGLSMSPEQRVAKLLDKYSHLFDREAGPRLVNELLRRSGGLLPASLNALNLGRHFPLQGYQSLLQQLLPELLQMFKNHEFERQRDSYIRLQHIFQLVAAPGMGKTTASNAMFAALHHVYNTPPGQWSTLLPAGLASEDAPSLATRVNNSFGPDNFLVFSLPLTGA